MGRKGKRDGPIPGIIGSKNNGARPPHAFAGGAEGGLSDGERDPRSGVENKKKAVLKKQQKKTPDCFLFSLGPNFFKEEVVIPSLCSVVTSSIKYIKPPHKKGIKQSI